MKNVGIYTVKPVTVQHFSGGQQQYPQVMKNSTERIANRKTLKYVKMKQKQYPMPVPEIHSMIKG